MIKIGIVILALLALGGCASMEIMKQCRPVMEEPDLYVCKKI